MRWLIFTADAGRHFDVNDTAADEKTSVLRWLATAPKKSHLLGTMLIFGDRLWLTCGKRGWLIGRFGVCIHAPAATRQHAAVTDSASGLILAARYLVSSSSSSSSSARTRNYWLRVYNQSVSVGAAWLRGPDRSASLVADAELKWQHWYGNRQLANRNNQLRGTTWLLSVGVWQSSSADCVSATSCIVLSYTWWEQVGARCFSYWYFSTSWPSRRRSDGCKSILFHFMKCARYCHSENLLSKLLY